MSKCDEEDGVIGISCLYRVSILHEFLAMWLETSYFKDMILLFNFCIKGVIMFTSMSMKYFYVYGVASTVSGILSIISILESLASLPLNF
jgi:hypothetical protein